MKRMLTVFLVSVLLVTNVQAIFVFAQTDKHSFFGSFDEQRQTLLANAASDIRADSDSVPLMNGNGERYIVRFRQSIPEKEVFDCVSKHGFRLLANSKERMFLLYISDIELFTRQYSDITEYIQKDTPRNIEAKTLSVKYNDTLLDSAWEYEMMNIEQAWNISGSLDGITVAVLDSGIFREHEDLANAHILNGFDAVEQVEGVYCDDFGHGTKVAGIIAACANNGKGIAGVAHGVQLLPVCIVNMFGQVYSSDFVSAVYFAADSGSDVINMSIGGYEYIQAEADAIEYAANCGCILVASAGNEGNSIEYAGQKSYPASYDRVISVASVDQSGTACVFSQYNDKVDISAPGKDVTVLSTATQYAYAKSSGTSFSAPYVSGIAALALASLDEGFKLGTDEFEALIKSKAKGESGDRYGAGIIDAAEIIKHVNEPIICGITDGGTYFGNPTITFNRGTALLDGEAFNSGELCKVSGIHDFEIFDGDYYRSIPFTTDNLPLKYTYTVRDSYAFFSFERGTAQIDGYPYASGSHITVEGDHTFVLTGPFGNTESKEFSLSFTPARTMGVSDGETYTSPVAVTVCGEGKVYLNDKLITNTYIVHENGDYTLQSFAADGSAEHKIGFKVDISGIEEYDAVVAGAKIIVDEQNGYVAVYSDALTGLRIHKMSDLSKIASFVNFQKNILGYTFFGEYLILYHTDSVAFINRSELTKNAAVEKSIKLDAEVTAYCRSGNTLYFTAKKENGSIIGCIDLETEAISNIARIGVSTDIIAFDSVTDTVILADSDSESGDLYTVNASQKTVSIKHTESRFKNGNILCANGTVAIGSDVYSTSTFKRIYSFGDTSKVIFLDSDTLITQKAIYDLAEERRTGIFPHLTEEIVFADKVYTVHSGNVLSVSDTECFACADIYLTTNQKPYNYDPFTVTKNAKSNICSAAFDGTYVYALAENEPAMFILDGTSFNCLKTVYLRMIPNEIKYREGYIYISFNGSDMLYRYGIPDAKGEYLSFDTNGAITHFEPYADCIVILSEGYIKMYDRNGGTPIYSFSEKNIEAFTLCEESDSMYIGFSSSIFKVVKCIDLTTFSTVASSAVDYYLDGMWCDGKYLYINTVVYDGKSLKTLSSAKGRVLARSGDVLILDNGLYNIKTNSSVSKYNIKCDGFLPDGKGGAVYFKDNSLFRIFNGDATLIRTPAVYGIEDGAEYYAGTTVNYDIGVGYINGSPVDTFFTVKDGGKHSFALLLPYGRKYTYDFTVFATLDTVSFKNSELTLSVNEKATLEPEFHPKGAPSVELTYSVSGNVVAVTKNGVVTALNPGTAVITASSADGKYTARATVTVNAVTIGFKTSLYKLDRAGETIKGISSGTSAAAFLASLKDGTAQFTVIKKQNGETVQSGIVATGMYIELLNVNGETQDKAYLCVTGDADGDGVITVGDLTVANEMKRSPNSFTRPYIEAVCFGNSKNVTDGDILKLKTHLVGLTSISAYTAVPNLWSPSLFSASIESLSATKDSVTVTVSAAALSDTLGVSFTVGYDSKLLSVRAVNGAVSSWGNAHHASDGKIRVVAFAPNNESKINGTSDFINIVFDIVSDVQPQYEFKLSEITVYDGTARYCDDAKSSLSPDGKHDVSDDTSATARSAALENITASVGTLSPAFAQLQFNYILTVPAGTERVQFDCTPVFPSTSVTVKGSQTLSPGNETVYRIYCSNDTASCIYTVTVTFASENSASNGSDTSDAESGGNTAVTVITVFAVLIIFGGAAFIIIKKGVFSKISKKLSLYFNFKR